MLKKIAILVAVLAIVFRSEAVSNAKPQTFVVTSSNQNDLMTWLCSTNMFGIPIPGCPTTTTKTTLRTTTATTTPSTTTFDIFDETSASPSRFTLDTTVDNLKNSSSTPTPLESAHWCRLTNGSYLPLGYVFMNTPCTLCQCTEQRAVRCASLQCMPTTCIDGSTPTTEPDQCCSQCAYEQKPLSCMHQGYKFPHGTIIKTSGDVLRCWCQMGVVECRQTSASVYSNLDFWGSGTAIYVIVIVVILILLIGTLLCCGCSVLFYYYYKRHQPTMQAADERNWGGAGWQPMNEDGAVVDGNNEHKQEEAEQSQQHIGHSEAYIPPPYALYNGAYVSEIQAKQ